jgi:hypothetical protein
LALPRDGKWAENSSLARRTRVIQNPIADFGLIGLLTINNRAAEIFLSSPERL